MSNVIDIDSLLKFFVHSAFVPILGIKFKCYNKNRFTKLDIKRLADAFHLPSKYVGYNGTIANGMEAILLLLRRMVYLNRLCDLVKLFGRSVPEMSIIINMIGKKICCLSL